MRNEPIKVLIVDDSVIFRELLAKELSDDPRIMVVGKATDPFDARDKIILYRPDILTLDIEMPKMNGIEFLRQLMPQYPLPVIMVSSADKCVFDAIRAGAVDFVSKPVGHSKADFANFASEIKSKIFIASEAKLGLKLQDIKDSMSNQIHYPSGAVVAIGSSTGGTEALENVLKRLPAQFPATVIVQHMPPVFTKLFAERLNSKCQMQIKEAETGDRLRPGLALIAQGDKQMRVVKDGSTGYRVVCDGDEKVNGHCPSVDVLFESVANSIGSSAVGVILTGMGSDGAKGLLSMRNKGSFTVGQNESSCVVYGMPKVAFEVGAVQKQADLYQIPTILNTYFSNKIKRV